MAEWDASLAVERVLRDALWRDLGVGVRLHQRIGWFSTRAGDQTCLVVDADILGEPDPDGATVLEVAWYTRQEVDRLGHAGLLAGGFEAAAIDHARTQRERELGAVLRRVAGVLAAASGSPDEVVDGAPPPPGGTCWSCGRSSQHRPWCPAR